MCGPRISGPDEASHPCRRPTSISSIRHGRAAASRLLPEPRIAGLIQFTPEDELDDGVIALDAAFHAVRFQVLVVALSRREPQRLVGSCIAVTNRINVDPGPDIEGLV